MNPFLDLFTWLLEKDIRAKNAGALLIALLSVTCFYFSSRHFSWFKELDRFGVLGVAVALLIVFLIAFLASSLIFSSVESRRHRAVSALKSQQKAEQRKAFIRNNLESLTDWQRRFLLRFIVERRTQIPEFEVGQYKAAWDFEMAVLVEKGIVIEHRRAGVYEIEPSYHAYLRDHWQQDTGELA
jgi:hypothetical protein